MNTKPFSQESALKVSNLSINYDQHPVLCDISLEVPSGHLVGIVGPNGAGKTTFLKAVLGLLPPITGKIEFFGQTLRNVRSKIAYVPQRQSVDWDFPITVRDLVLMGCYGRLGLFRRPKTTDWEAADRCLDMVGMSQYASRQISQLSGGQQQRVFIARALLQEADIYFLDEPFAGIDQVSEVVIMNILHNLKAQGKTAFVVHHDLDTIEKCFDWAILLNIRLIACGEIRTALTKENLNLTYGKSHVLLSESFELPHQNPARL